MSDYLYVAGPEEGPVKIGISCDPFKRMSQLRTSSPNDIRMIGCFEIEDASQTLVIEKTVHSVLHEHRLNGEWFSVSACQAIDAVRATSKATGIELFHAVPIKGQQQQPKVISTRVGRKPGPKPSGKAKKLISLRIDQDVIEGFKSSGEGWQGRINEALRQHLNLD